MGRGKQGYPPPTIDPKICLKNGPKAVLLGEFYFCLKWGRGAVVSLPKAAITYTWMLDRYVLLEVQGFPGLRPLAGGHLGRLLAFRACLTSSFAPLGPQAARPAQRCIRQRATHCPRSPWVQPSPIYMQYISTLIINAVQKQKHCSDCRNILEKQLYCQTQKQTKHGKYQLELLRGQGYLSSTAALL